MIKFFAIATLKMIIPFLVFSLICMTIVSLWYYPKYKETKKGLLTFLMEKISK